MYGWQSLVSIDLYDMISLVLSLCAILSVDTIIIDDNFSKILFTYKQSVDSPLLDELYCFAYFMRTRDDILVAALVKTLDVPGFMGNHLPVSRRS